MALDLYAPCPCGSGKKIKFCCSHDIISDLDKIARSLEGEQRIAALDQINRTMVAKGKRPALLCLKTSVLLSTRDIEQAQQTVDEFLEVAPTNPAALAQASVISSLRGNQAAAVDTAQRALEAIGDVMPPELYQALDVLARQFVATGNVMAARAHLMLLIGLSEEERERPSTTFVQLNMSPQVPLLMKQNFVLSEAPEGVAWEEEFDSALDLADRQAWQAACEKLVALAGKVPPHSAILKNIAILRSWLGDIPVATAAWHAYAESEDVARDDAIEAEALAQLLDPDTYQEKLDQLKVVYTVNNTEKLMERLLSDRRVSRMPIDPAELARDDEPPPKAIFWLLDRAVPATGVGLARNEVPCVLGEIAVYGKQTDREARLEFIVVRTKDFANRSAALASIAGEYMNNDPKEEVIERVSSVGEAITWRWRFPDDTPDTVRDQLISEQRRETLQDLWPTLPLSILDGKSAIEAAKDESYHIRLLAAILLLELSGHQNRWDMDLNDLRRKLNLPTREEVELGDRDIERLSLLRLSLLNPKKLSDEDLIRALQRAAMYAEHSAAKKFALEVINRPSLQGQESVIYAYELLAGTAATGEESVNYLRKGREVAEAQKLSPAPLLLNELQYYLSRGKAEDSTRVVEMIQRRHIREPGIAQRLFQILVHYGVLSPDGTPRHRREEASLVGASAPAPASGGIWTPGSDQATPAAGESKSKLWLPGME